MPTYTIIGNDLKEYGPVSAEQIREWIAEGRVDEKTKLKAEGDVDWKRLGDLPEWKESLGETSRISCPSCGEPIEDGFDSCWKCGTSTDGSAPKQEIPAKKAEAFFADASSLDVCPRCGSQGVKPGKLLAGGESSGVSFQPEGTRFFSSFFGCGVRLPNDEGIACLNCGLVWSQLESAKLREFVARHCIEPGKERL